MQPDVQTHGLDVKNGQVQNKNEWRSDDIVNYLKKPHHSEAIPPEEKCCLYHASAMA